MQNPRKAWLRYSIIRLLLFAIPFGLIFFLAQLTGMAQLIAAAIAAVLAALISFSLSLVLLRKEREAASASIYEWRQAKRTHDEIVEDDALDAAAAQNEAAASKQDS